MASNPDRGLSVVSRHFPGGRGRLGAPPRDNAPAPTGTARIPGRVLSTEAGTPIRRAQIRLNSQDARVNRVNDDRQRRPIRDWRPPAGGEISPLCQQGWIRQFGVRTGAAVRSGRADLPLRWQARWSGSTSVLPRGSVVGGRITDEQGDAVTDAQVQAMRHQLQRRASTGVRGAAGTTDDLGEFRLFGLMPGEYVVRASLREGPAVMRDADGKTGYPGTYFPGVADVAQAQAVTVALGQELTRWRFRSFPPVRASPVSRWPRMAGRWRAPSWSAAPSHERIVLAGESSRRRRPQPIGRGRHIPADQRAAWETTSSTCSSAPCGQARWRADAPASSSRRYR